jgi:SRSO17 transposase
MAGVPYEMRFARKTLIALAQMRTLLDEDAPRYCMLADAGYRVDNAFRQSLSEMGLLYAVGVTSAVLVWPPGIQPLPPKPYSDVGRPPVVTRCTANLQPVNVKALAQSLRAEPEFRA